MAGVIKLIKSNLKNFLTFRISFIVLIISFIVNEFYIHKNYVLYRFEEKISSIESTINNEISDVNHILYGLSTTIAENILTLHHEKLQSLIENFEPKYIFDEQTSIPFAGIIVLNYNDTEIANSITSKFNKISQKEKSYDALCCSKESGEDFFKLKVSSPRIGYYAKEQVIPINMKIQDVHKNFIGTICSGLVIKDLNHKLSARFAYSQHVNGIRIVSLKDGSDNKELEDISSVDFLISFMFNKKLIVSHKLKKYPFSIEVKLKHTFFKETVLRLLLFFLCSFIIFTFYSYILLKKNKTYYESPLREVYSKIIKLNATTKNEKIANEVIFSPKIFASYVDELIDYHYNKFLDKIDPSVKQDEIKKRISNLIFIEQHFMNIKKTDITQEKIYLNYIYELSNEEAISMNLYEFFKEFVEYCSEFYYELNIRLVIEPQDRKNFSFKKSALVETIFSILTFAARSSFQISESIIIRVEFRKGNDFPTFIIDMNNETTLKNIGQDFGPYLTNTSMLSAYLLAKENKLSINIKVDNNILSFILESESQKVKFYNLALIE